jgi:hypothetical protein
VKVTFGPGFALEHLTPAFVAERMRHLSTVTFEEIEVQGL